MLLAYLDAWVAKIFSKPNFLPFFHEKTLKEFHEIPYFLKLKIRSLPINIQATERGPNDANKNKMEGRYKNKYETEFRIHQSF